VLAKASIGFSGADIKNLVNLAALSAVTSNRALVTHEDLEQALDRIRMGT
jgi:cell division protease FtsH